MAGVAYAPARKWREAGKLRRIRSAGSAQRMSNETPAFAFALILPAGLS
jgi:hypothetical protein